MTEGRARAVVVPRTARAGGPAGWWEMSEQGDVRAVFDADLNMALGKGGRNRPGGMPWANPSAPKTIEIPKSLTDREMRLAQNKIKLDKFYNELPRRRARQKGLEYAILVSLAVETIGFAAGYFYMKAERAAEQAEAFEALRAGADSE
jgi:hypothetical protein